MTQYARELDVATAAARQAGELLLGFFRQGVDVDHKSGGEPVTEADRASEALILETLRREFPDDGILSEEQPDRESWATHARAWVVDPMDGTREFVDGGEGFSVLIGLVQGGRPVMGVVYQPTAGRLYRAATDGQVELLVGGRSVGLAPSRVRDLTQAGLVTSRSHRDERMDDLMAALGVTDERQMGSCGLKVASVAAGQRDLYITPTGECKIWDSCAAEAILSTAGGRITDLRGQALVYDEPARIRLAHGIVATNGLLHDQVIERIQPLLQ